MSIEAQQYRHIKLHQRGHGFPGILLRITNGPDRSQSGDPFALIIADLGQNLLHPAYFGPKCHPFVVVDAVQTSLQCVR